MCWFDQWVYTTLGVGTVGCNSEGFFGRKPLPGMCCKSWIPVLSSSPIMTNFERASAFLLWDPGRYLTVKAYDCNRPPCQRCIVTVLKNRWSVSTTKCAFLSTKQNKNGGSYPQWPGIPFRNPSTSSPVLSNFCTRRQQRTPPLP